MASSSEEANLLGKRKPEDGLGTEPVLKKHKEKSEEKEIESSVELFSVESNLISVEGIDETPAETVETKPIQEPKKTVLVSNLPVYTKISDILCFFQNVGQVVRVRLILNNQGIFKGDAFVEFASADQANKALKEKKFDKFLSWRTIFLAVANKGAPFFPPKYCIDHKVWYLEDEYSLQQVEEDEDYLQQVEEGEDYLQQGSLPIEEDETPPNAEEASVIFIANLSPHTKIQHIIKFFKAVGDVVSVRLIVNQQHKHVGYAFVEFASADQANWVLENKNGEYLHDHEILLMKRPEDAPDFSETATTVRDKTLFIDNISIQTKISHIINFFKDVGEVVHVRLIVGPKGGPLGFGYVEFASATDAEKVMEKKNGEYLKTRQISLAFAKEAPKRSQTKYCIDHKVWYEDYLQRESLLLQDAAVQGLDETPDFVEEVSSMRKTVFADLSKEKNMIGNIPNIISFFEDIGKVASVRLIVDHWGINLGCCFVEFATGIEAKKVVYLKDRNGVYVNRAEIAPYPFRPKYNLSDLAEKLWYEDKLRREGFGLPTRSKLKKEEALISDEKVTFSDEKVTFCGQRIDFSDEEK